MSAEYDGIILGTGHNALVLQAYLSRAGLRVLSLDRASVAGGGLATVDNPRLPGFRHNTHSFFHRAITMMPWYRDLELKRHGAVYIEPELNVAMILPDGRSLEWWVDFDKTIDSFAEFSKRDAATLRRWVDEFRPIVEQIILPEVQSPPLPPQRRTRAVAAIAPGPAVLGGVGAHAARIRSAGIRARRRPRRTAVLQRDARGRPAGTWVWPLDCGDSRGAPQSADVPGRLGEARRGDRGGHQGAWRRGPHRRAAEGHSDRERTGDRRGAGRWRADRRRRAFVASGLNPQQTFLDLLDAEATPRADARGRRRLPVQPDRALVRPESGAPGAAAICGRGAAAGIEPGVHGHPGPGADGPVPRDGGRRTSAGKSRPTIMWGTSPTQFDPSQAPPGDTRRSCGRSSPTHYTGTPRTGTPKRSEHGRAMLALWARFAPNLAEEGTVLDAFTRSPLDTERSLPNMSGGDLLVGSLSVRTGRLPQAFRRRRSVSDPCRRPLPVWRVNASGGQHHGLVRLQRRRGAGRRSGPGHVVESAAGGARLASSMKSRPSPAAGFAPDYRLDSAKIHHAGYRVGVIKGEPHR